MEQFIMFYAPFIVLIGLIIAAFVVAPMDGWVVKKEKKRKKDVPAVGEQAIDSSIDSGQQGVSAEQAPLLAVQEEDGEGQ